MILIASLSMLGHADDPIAAPTDNPHFVSLIEQLSLRESASKCGQVRFSRYHFGVAAESAEHLAQVFDSSRLQANAGLRATLNGAIGAVNNDHLAAWTESISIANGKQLHQQVRIPGLDRTKEFLEEAAAASGTQPGQVHNHETRWTDNQVVVTVRGDRSVLSEPAHSSVSWFFDLDRTAADWSSALNPATVRPEQTVTVEHNGALVRLIYLSIPASGKHYRTVYTFDSERDYAPLSIVSTIDGEIAKCIRYGYERHLESEIVRPSEVLSYTVDDAGSARVQLYIIQSWSDEATPESTILRKPPFHLHVNMTVAGAEPTTEMVKPQYLIGIETTQYAQAAAEYILTRLGTTDPDADYDLDGTVTEADVFAAMELFEVQQ